MHHLSKIWGCDLQFWFILILAMCELYQKQDRCIINPFLLQQAIVWQKTYNIFANLKNSFYFLISKNNWIFRLADGKMYSWKNISKRDFSFAMVNKFWHFRIKYWEKGYSFFFMQKTWCHVVVIVINQNFSLLYVYIHTIVLVKLVMEFSYGLLT